VGSDASSGTALASTSTAKRKKLEEDFLQTQIAHQQTRMAKDDAQKASEYAVAAFTGDGLEHGPSRRQSKNCGNFLKVLNLFQQKRGYRKK
jgi:hypothetical protein